MEEQLKSVVNELNLVGEEIEKLLQRQEILLSQKRAIEKQLAECRVEDSSDSSACTSNETNWASREFTWSEKVDAALRNVFHIEKFRSLQLECINITMSGLDCILVMPTGGGKSLCFQLPAVVSEGLTLVISPLVSLMEDQLMCLRELNVNAHLLNASSSKEHVNMIHSAMVDKNAGLKMLYVTPEKISKSKRFMAKLEKTYGGGLLSRIVIDEVHCASQWGHDFRPDYKILGILKRQFPSTPILGLTATATSNVIDDCKKILSLKPDCVLLKASFNRPNLYYEVLPKKSASKDSLNDLADLILSKFPGQSGIVYCFSRKDTEEVSRGLNERGVQSGFYHAYVEASFRSRVHRQWVKNQIQVVVATVAFGMGIDKPDVRFVIHHSLSKSMENFYQESGRAGRDDKPAHCILYYHPSDAYRQSTMVFVEQTGLQNLYNMLRYCQDQTTCRRTIIGRYFGEYWDEKKCRGMCDHCKNRISGSNHIVTENITQHCIPVLRILDHASKLSERMTANKVVDSWRGTGPKKLHVPGMEGTKLKREECELLLIDMMLQDVTREDFHFTPYSSISYVLTGTSASAVLSGRKQIVRKIVQHENSLIKQNGSLSSITKPSHQSGSSKIDLTEEMKLKTTKRKKIKTPITNKQSGDRPQSAKKRCTEPLVIDIDDDDD